MVLYIGEKVKLRKNPKMKGVIYEIKDEKYKVDMADRDFIVIWAGMEVKEEDIKLCNNREIGDVLFWDRYWEEIEKLYK